MASKWLPFSHEGYHQDALGSFEVFEQADGWYWWSCWPGCLPDSDKFGPHKTSQEAYDEARSYANP